MEREVSCVSSKNLFEYVRYHTNIDCSSLLVDLDPWVQELRQPLQYLSEPNNWISTALFAKLMDRAKRVLGDEMLPYKVGKFSVENAHLGYAQLIFVKTFWSTRRGLQNLQKINDKWNRNKRIELVEIKGNEAVVRLHWNSDMGGSKDICNLNKGTYTFAPMIWGGSPMNLVEKCCYFDGAPYCEYYMKWRFRNKLHEILSSFFTSKAVLRETIKEIEEDKKIIEQQYEEVHRLNLKLRLKVKQMTALQETGKAILSVLDLGQLLEVIINRVCDVCNLNRAIIMLVNEGKGALEYISGVGLRSEDPEKIKNYRVPLDRLSNILARVANTGRSEYIPDVKTSRLRKENIILTTEKPTSVYVVPLITRSKVIGVIATDGIDGTGVPEDARETLETFAPQIAIAIENARLYRKLQDQMEELKRSRVLLSRAEKLSYLGNIAARLAHEIKNPMTAIATYIQLLPNKYEDEEFRNSFYTVAKEEAFRINNLLTELLDLFKKREPHFEFGDLHDLIDKVILLMSPQSKSKKIAVERRFEPGVGLVWMDQAKMKEVILNIISNAVDFAPQEGRIDVQTSLSHSKGESKIQIFIKDNGPGIPEYNTEKIFDPYFTTKHKSSIHQGTGLGLFIAHQNMQEHAGTIEVKSKVNVGTTFVLTLPYGAPADTQSTGEDHGGN